MLFYVVSVRKARSLSIHRHFPGLTIRHITRNRLNLSVTKMDIGATQIMSHQNHPQVQSSDRQSLVTQVFSRLKERSQASRNAIRRLTNRVTPLQLHFALAAVTMPIFDLGAETFRVTTKVYSGKNTEAASEHVILFQEGLTYDFPQISNRFVTIFDSGKKRVTIMDRETQVQATVSEEDLIKVTAQARAAASTAEKKKQLGINAMVEESHRVDGYQIRFGNLEYHLTSQKPSSEAVAKEFAKFFDLAARLNLVRRLGPPPFGRMTLNQHLASKQEIPRETLLILNRDTGAQEYRSTLKLEVLEDFSKLDREKIQEAVGMRAIYRQVDLKSFPSL